MWPYPRVLAHRGGGILAPENTLAALRCGLAHGFHAVEFDVMLSQDQIPIVIHDPTFGRTVAGSGNVADQPAAALLAMDAGTWFGPAFAGEKIPGFEQVVAYCRANRIWMNVEIKPTPGLEEATGRVVATMVQHLYGSAAPVGAGDDMPVPLLSSFSMTALLAARAAAPEVPRALLLEHLPLDWRQQRDRAGAVSIHLDQKFLTAALAATVKQAGCGLFCYTVNDPARAAQLLAWGVDAFCTDRIDLIGADFCVAGCP